MSKFNRGSYDYARSERVSWLDEFADNIEKASKTAVEVARNREQVSLHDQINSIMSGRQTFATVEEIVQDYQDRTGLSEYMKKAQLKEIAEKIAFSMNEGEEAFAKFPALKDNILDFAKNRIATSYGQISVPAIQDEILSQFGSEGVLPQDIENEKVAKIISNLIADAQRENPSTDTRSPDLGKGVGVVDVDIDDAANTDFYHGLMPNTD